MWQAHQILLEAAVRTFLLHPTARRWIDLSLLTVVGVVVFQVFQPEIDNLSNAFLRRSQPWSLSATVFFLALLSWALAILLIRLGALRRGHFTLRRLIGFPPVWISAVICNVVIFEVRGTRVCEPVRMPWAACVSSIAVGFISILSGIALALLAESLDKTARRFPRTRMVFSGSLGQVIHDHERLLTWLEEERPIQNPSEDIFGYSPIARRIAGTLRGERIRTVGIVGPYGTGKSSLLNLTQHYLHHPQELTGAGFDGEVIVCRVDGWGRTKASSAERVLAIAIDHVSAFADCSSILSLPASYRRAIGGMRWPGGPVLEALLEESRDPVALIRRLDDILRAAGIRLVIFLEDLDRNTADEIIRDEIPSLLDRLREMRNLSFVLAIGTEHQYSAILIRICDFIEAIA
jgi:hypothetical protein